MNATATKTASELETLDQEIALAKSSREQIDQHIAELEKKRRKLRPRAPLDPHKQAGPKNVELMRGVFRGGRTLTAAEATARAGSEPGHQVWAIRALLAEGAIEETGFQVGVSREYRYVPKSKQKATRMKPGS